MNAHEHRKGTIIIITPKVIITLKRGIFSKDMLEKISLPILCMARLSPEVEIT